MSDYKTLNRKRGGLKHSLTSFKSFIDKIIEINEGVIVELGERVNKIELVYHEFCEIQNKIEEVVNDDEIQSQYEERETFNTEYFQNISRAKTIIKNFEAENEQNSSNGSMHGFNNHNICNNVKLPPLTMKQFSGSYESWIEFRDTFESVVHTNTNISNIQKLHYLRSCLFGQASQIIKFLEISDQNYKVAWTLLCERYDNKRLLVFNHLKALFNLSYAKSESVYELRKLLDEFSKHLSALEVLGQPTKDTLLLYMLTTKLDSQTKRDWESEKIEEFPNINSIQNFLRKRCELLETLENQNKRVAYSYTKQTNKVDEKVSTLLVTEKPQLIKMKCNFCNKTDHLIYTCEKFLQLDAQERKREIQLKRLCLNCLKENHISAKCRAYTCKICHRKHHTLLHLDIKTHEREQTNSLEISNPNDESNVIIANLSNVNNEKVLLSTAGIYIKNQSGHEQYCRSLLDSGSEASFITTSLCNSLGLKKEEINFEVRGINKTISHLKYRTEINIRSLCRSYSLVIACLVIDKITEDIPQNTFDISNLKIPTTIKLADKKLNIRGQIDVLLGANIFWDLLCPNKIILGKNKPVLQETLLGWVLAGPFIQTYNKASVSCNLVTNTDIQDTLKRFWELEDVGSIESKGTNYTKDEQYCEELYKQTTERNEEGRYVVNIPFKQPRIELGNSFNIAKNRFYGLEKRLENNSELRKQYVEFMREYETLGHMSKVDDPWKDIKNTYYLPHHGVLRESSTSTKLRVVFNASCKTTNGLSLNEIQHIGPTIQEELFDILLRFRTYTYVLTADIVKMYRQISIKPEDRNYQRIIWREDKTDRLQHYKLNTVTYGTASAPYLAIRSLQQVAHENKTEYPKASKMILKNFYVDDLLMGATSKEETLELYRHITRLLSNACFELRKWVSNSIEIIKFIGEDNQSSKTTLFFGNQEKTKLLGLIWTPTSDNFKYEIGDLKNNTIVTKRQMLSEISKIFDPLGLIGPCVITAKVMLQQLWKNNLDWNDEIPEDIKDKWIKFKESLFYLNKIEIPRMVCCFKYENIELHVFSDASQLAYGSCIYVRNASEKGVRVTLLCAKSKVAPIKKLTTPKLELCAALLGARLTIKVKNALDLKFNRTWYWCDSTIVLSWIRMPADRLKLFTSNRVTEIQNASDINCWNHVEGENNPADLISRGTTPEKLQNSLWWNGPLWLSLSESHWPKPFKVDPESNVPEVKVIALACTTARNENFLFHYTSSYSKLQRVVAWCLRFVNNCKSKKKYTTGHLTIYELDKAMKCLVKLAQKESFPDIIEQLKNRKNLQLEAKFMQLSPFLDNENLIRVGGRLQNSLFNFNKKHPLLLSGKHAFSKIIYEYEHIRLMHAGPQLMLASVRERFWVMAGRNLAKKIYHNCIKCYRVKPTQSFQFMGDLPAPRVVPMYPFYTTGVDYAGPFLLKERKGRGSKTIKAYICLFICFSVKAIHLEPVTQLDTQSFIATLRRFIARRGSPSHIYSDNGSNFKGAASELKELGKFIRDNNESICDWSKNQNISWHFIPANSPHFGGLWESGIKSTKYHLKRVLGNSLINFEDFLTVLVQVEAILNSRPISPLSDSPNDLQPLTPSHFLLGRNATAIPDPDVTDISINRLSRFQHMQSLSQHFWKRWSLEYINGLQQRSKWTKENQNVNVGDLIIIKEENQPPLKWKMGRIVTIHPGTDGKVRVVSIKTSAGVLKRAVTKICVIPNIPKE